MELHPLDAIDTIFAHCRDDALVAWGTRRPLPDGEISPHAKFITTVEKIRGTHAPLLIGHRREDETGYIARATFNRRALFWGYGIEDYWRAIEAGAPLPLGATGGIKARKDNIYELAMIGFDLDVGRDPDGPDAWDALAEVGRRTQRAENPVPLPSLAALSGRGAYIMYLLTDTETGLAPKYTPTTGHQFEQCWDEIHKRIKDLKSDTAMKDKKGWQKAPGAYDTKTGQDVVYMTFGIRPPGTDPVPRYALPDLCRGLGLPLTDWRSRRQIASVPRKRLPAPRKRAQPAPTPSARPKRPRRGGNTGAPHKQRAMEMEKISTHRGGFPDGMRTRALHHYFLSRYFWLRADMIAADVPITTAYARADAQARADTHELARRCRPFKPPGEVEYICRLPDREPDKPARWYKPRNWRVAEDLGVTADEVAALGLSMLVPKDMADKLKAGIRELILAGERNCDICAVLPTTPGQVSRIRRELTPADRRTTTKRERARKAIMAALRADFKTSRKKLAERYKSAGIDAAYVRHLARLVKQTLPADAPLLGGETPPRSGA